jgi:hypothetical protein
VLSRERWPDKGDLILYALSLPKFSGVVAACYCTSGGNEVLPNFFKVLMGYVGTPRTFQDPWKEYNWCLKTPEAEKQACVRAVFP